MAEMVAEEAEQEMIARWLEEAPVVLDAIARDEDHRALDTGRVAVGRRHLYLLMIRI